MYFESIIFFNVLLYHLISYFFFRLACFYPCLNIFQRNLSFALAEFNFDVDMTVRFFGKKNQCLHVTGLREHIEGRYPVDIINLAKRFQVPRQRGGIAGYVKHLIGP